MCDVIAKSNGESLSDHSNKVGEIALELLTTLKSIVSDNDCEIIKHASVLHDIGKCTKNFQDYIKGNESEYPKYLHHDISWAFVCEYVILPNDIKKYVLDAIFWHHGSHHKKDAIKFNNSHVLESLSDDDIVSMIQYAESFGYICEESYSEIRTPSYYYDDDNAQISREMNNRTTIYRSCLVASDRLVSSEKSMEDIKKFILSSRDGNIDIETHPFYGSERTDMQNKIVSDIQEYNTNLINAPAGFGKTFLEILDFSRSNKKLLWVCPRNTVADSVYNSILDILSKCDNNISIELYLSGDTVQKNENSLGDFTSDIIVTNIDNFLKPGIDNSKLDLVYSVLNYDVCFDEYHEFITDSALFEFFLNIMRIRHNHTSNKTILLSATPSLIFNEWKGLSKESNHLPGKFEHFDAQHEKKYLIKIHENVPDVETDNNLCIFNSVSSAQSYMYKNNYDNLIHSRFNTDDRKDIMDSIYNTNGSENDLKSNTVSSPILEASVDVSFNHLYEVIASPESSLQRIGRVNRWGDMDNATINFIVPNGNSEKKSIDVKYGNNIWQLWLKMLRTIDDQYLTLNELYTVYNDFIKSNERTITRFIKNKDKKSREYISGNIYLRKYKGARNEDVRVAGSNKLRASINKKEIFFTCKDEDGNYIDAMNQVVHNSFSDDFDEDGNILPKLKGVIDELISDERFDYSVMTTNKHKWKRIHLETIIRKAKLSISPYIRFDVTYSKKYGIIKNKLLKEFV